MFIYLNFNIFNWTIISDKILKIKPKLNKQTINTFLLRSINYYNKIFNIYEWNYYINLYLQCIIL